MRKEEILAMLSKVLGLAMILAGICSAAVQLANGGAPPRPWQANTVAAQAAETPRIENAKLATRAVGASLDATFREIADPGPVGWKKKTVARRAPRTQMETLNWKAHGNSSCSIAWKPSRS